MQSLRATARDPPIRLVYTVKARELAAAVQARKAQRARDENLACVGAREIDIDVRGCVHKAWTQKEPGGR